MFIKKVESTFLICFDKIEETFLFAICSLFLFLSYKYDMFLIFILELKGQYQQVLSFPIRINSMSKKREKKRLLIFERMFQKRIFITTPFC
jgi:hypothetical protein